LSIDANLPFVAGFVKSRAVLDSADYPDSRPARVTRCIASPPIGTLVTWVAAAHVAKR
jgi:hypothetical protein